MKNLLLGGAILISAFFTLSVSATEPPDGNLIVNGGFEHNVDNDLYPDHWSFLNYAPGGDIRLVQGGAHCGSAAMRLSVPKDGSGNQVIIGPGLANSDIPCVEGQKYTLSVWAKTEGAAQAFLESPDHKGYTQELSIPWKLLAKPGVELKPGSRLLVTSQSIALVSSCPINFTAVKTLIVG